MPYGVVGSFSGQVMPYLAQHANIKLDKIGWYNAVLLFPPMVQFLYAPIVDIGPKRKHWLILVAVIGAGFLVAACVTPIGIHPYTFLVFGVLAQLISGLVGSCNGGLLAVSIPDDKRGKAGGWYNIGNLSGGGLSAAIAIWEIGQECSPLTLGLTLAAMMVIPSFAALVIEEPERSLEARNAFKQTLRDVRAVLFSKSGLTGIALCISPVGTAALTNYFSGMTDIYGVDPEVVALVSGLAGVALTALGAYVGGWLCDRYNRRALYLLSGALTAICAIVMANCPNIQITYVVGVMTYALITGFCYSAFTATVLETIGVGGKAASTQYAMFVAAGNAAIWYVGLVDTQFSKDYGVEGTLYSDAALNLIGVAILGLVFWRLKSFGKSSHPPVEPELAPAPIPQAKVISGGDQ
jgi:PAT family beta-lactamase induction signal transducer AmpG